MEFRNHTREFFDWDTEDDLDGLLEPYHGSHPDLDYDLPGVLLEEDIPGPVAAAENEILDLNTIDAVANINGGITNKTVVCDYSNAPTPIFTINPTQPAPEAEPYPTPKAEPDDEDDEGYANDNDKVKEV